MEGAAWCRSTTDAAAAEPNADLGRRDHYHIDWMSRSPQSTQYVFCSRLRFPCFSSAHRLGATFALTTSPHSGQKRTGAFERR